MQSTKIRSCSFGESEQAIIIKTQQFDKLKKEIKDKQVVKLVAGSFCIFL